MTISQVLHCKVESLPYALNTGLLIIAKMSKNNTKRLERKSKCMHSTALTSL
jgi:hypothetical protein